MAVWVFSIAISVALMVVSASIHYDSLATAIPHMTIAACVCILVAMLAIYENKRMAQSGAKFGAIVGNSVRFTGFVWGWIAITLAATYGTGVLRWADWWEFALASALLSAMCLYFAFSLRREAERGAEDAAMVKIARQVAIVQFAGMVTAMAALVMEGKMVRFLNPHFTDWAANNVFFFGALAILAVSAYEIRARRRPDAS